MVHFVHDRSELEQWAITANWSAKRIEWLRIFISRFAIVPSSHEPVVKWAQAMAAARKNGRRIEAADAWIAATALLYDAPLLTHNKSRIISVLPGFAFLPTNE